MSVPSRLELGLGGRYAIERELGAGGMATVYLARDFKHDREVALKVLRPDLPAALGTERPQIGLQEYDSVALVDRTDLGAHEREQVRRPPPLLEVRRPPPNDAGAAEADEPDHGRRPATSDEDILRDQVLVIEAVRVHPRRLCGDLPDEVELLEAADPAAYAGALLLFVLAALVAALSPAIRVLRADPISALRHP